MLRFFRTIRKKLMEQNKIRTYILYAIGEILLVVFGILIALQLNEWRDNYLQRQKEIQTVRQLIIDLDTERESMQEFKTKLDTQRVATASFLKAIKQGEPLDSVAKYRYQTMNTWNYRPKHPTYDGLKLNGALDLISDDSLRTTIIYHFDYMVTYFEDLRVKYHTDIDNVDDALLPYIGIIPDDLAGFRKRSYLNLSALKEDSRTHHVLGRAGAMRQFLSFRIENLFIPKTEELETELRDYLEELSR
jgi:hypothetical protein